MLLVLLTDMLRLEPQEKVGGKVLVICKNIPVLFSDGKLTHVLNRHFEGGLLLDNILKRSGGYYRSCIVP